MTRRFKVGDKIRLKPHTLLGLKEYTWGIILIDEYDIDTLYPYKVKVIGNPPGVVEGLFGLSKVGDILLGCLMMSMKMVILRILSLDEV
jgi:hypothetical protein